MRLKDKIAIVIGAGQSPGEGMGNGRATVLRFTQEGAKVLAVDNRLASAEETVSMVRQQGGGECVAHVVKDGDAVLLPYGYHPVVSPPGYRLYYLWAMAGAQRKLALHEDPDHKWVHDAPST